MSAEIYRCSTCNSPLLADFKFCPSCGTPNAYYRPTEAATTTPAPPATNEPPTEQAGGSRDASAILDFAALFGYGNATEASSPQAQDSAQLSGTVPQPASEDSHQLQASSIEEIGSQIEPPLDEVSANDGTLPASEDGMQVQAPEYNAPEIHGAAEIAQVGMGRDTGPLLVTEPVSTPPGALPEEQSAESGAYHDGGNDIVAETPVPLQSNSQEPEQVHKAGASTGPLYVQEAPAMVMVIAEATGATLDPQDEPAATVMGHDEGAGEEVEQTPSSQPDQAAQANQAAQTGPLSFSDLFAWTTDESQPGSYDPLISTPARQEQDTSHAQASWQETSPPPTQLPQEQASEPAPAIVSYDSSSTHQETAAQYDAPSWKPGDEDQSASQQSSWTPSPTPTTPIYQSYSPSSSPVQPQTVPTSPDLPPPGQRPKPGTPEYEEMARRALETRGIQATPPQGYPPQGSQAGQASYTQPSRQQAPTPPVTPAVPPPGQRPKPGTPEYEEMARRAMEERLKQQDSGTPAQPTPAYGYTPQSPETNYAPPPPPVTPAVPPPGQRPKPGTPEYEEMARRALEERLKQQGK
jgi:hypothetical protein